MNEGDLLIDSELLLPASPRPWRRRTHAADHDRSRRQRTSTREQTVNRTATAAASPVLARIEYDDDAGHHSYDVVKDSVTIGRGGIAYPVDIRIASSPDVSREHARIRRDPKTGRFFLVDLSSLGTTLNGRHVPQGLRRGGWTQAGERNRDRVARHGADRSGRHSYFSTSGSSGDDRSCCGRG